MRAPIPPTCLKPFFGITVNFPSCFKHLLSEKIENWPMAISKIKNTWRICVVNIDISTIICYRNYFFMFWTTSETFTPPGFCAFFMLYLRKPILILNYFKFDTFVVFFRKFQVSLFVSSPWHFATKKNNAYCWIKKLLQGAPNHI